MLCFYFNESLSQKYFHVEIKEIESNELKQRNQREVNDFLHKNKCSNFRKSYPAIKTGRLSTVYTLISDDSSLTTKRLNTSGHFKKVEEFYLCDDALTTSTPYYPNDYAYIWANNHAHEMIESAESWGISKGDSSIVISIIDVGLDINHEDLKDKFVYIDPVLTNHYHGTAVSGCAATIPNNNVGICGIGFNTKLAFFDYWTTNGGTRRDELFNNIFESAQRGYQIANISSCYCEFNQSEQDLIDSAKSMGLIIVSTSGNTGSATCQPNSDCPTCEVDNGYCYPASYNGVVNVSGVTMLGNHSDFSAVSAWVHNDKVHLCAPADNVTTTFPDNIYGGAWGTSFAAPQVAGTIALMKEVNTCLDYNQILDIFQSNSDVIADASLFQGGLGYGRLNAYKAVKRAGTAYIQNETVNLDKHIAIGYQVFVGNNVTNEMPVGDVLLKNGKNMILEARNEVTLDKGFAMEIGSTLEINVDPNLVLSCY